MRFSVLALLCCAAIAGPASEAQPLPDSLVWEHLGPWRSYDSTLRQNADHVAFDLQGRLYLSPQEGTLVRWDPGGGWEVLEPGPGGHTSADFRFTDDGTAHGLGIRRDGRRLDRSHDGGETWDEMFDGLMPETWPARAPDGAWLVGTRGPTVARSTDEGQTWDERPVPVGAGSTSWDIVVLGPETAAPGTAVAAGMSGVYHSPDGGLTWQATELTCDFCTQGYSFAVLDGGPHAGELRVTLDDVRPGPGQGQGWVWASADGFSWWRVGSARPGYSNLKLVALPGGRLVAWDGADDLLRGSDDGGATWRDLGRVAGNRVEWERLRFKDVELGPDGRLYAALRADVGRPPGGVYRTTEPVFAVSAEPEAPGAPALGEGLGVRVRPNPSRAGRVAVSWDAAELNPELSAGSGGARVSVVDVRGRVVLSVEAAGGAGGGEAELDTSSLAPGVYAVRVAAGGAVGAAPLTVVR